ncbi:hypothetical protein MLD38_024456 [Melastoma candidum]|uniref:Uncharacterized protein n=1 Tax=Melastoma candidum TaxID=119954 RepID=A0ACB9NTA1_9MYRT|nr:hypothetical protein MLD38_024456 [Melastoma candidum]
MARNFFVLALMVAAIAGLTSAQGPSAAPTYAPTGSTIASAPTTSSAASPSISEAPEASTISAPPTTSAAAGPSISEAPESSSYDIASPPAPGSEAAEGPSGEFFAPVEAPVADTPAEAPESSSSTLKVPAIIGAAAVAAALLI